MVLDSSALVAMVLAELGYQPLLYTGGDFAQTDLVSA